MELLDEDCAISGKVRDTKSGSLSESQTISQGEN